MSTSVLATAPDSAAGAAPKSVAKAAGKSRGSPAPVTAPKGAVAEPVNGEVAQPARNGVTGRGDRQPANISMAQLAVRMSKRSGEQSVSTRGTTPAATSRIAAQAEEAETPAEEVATEQVAEADAGVNEVLDTSVSATGEPAETDTIDGAALEGAEVTSVTATGGEEGEEPEVLPKNVKELQARVNKLTARAKTAEAKLAALSSAATAAHEAGAAGKAPNGHPELQAIEGQLAVFREALEFAEANPDGGEYTDPASGRKTFYDAARVRMIRRNAEEGRQLALSDKAALQRQVQTEFAQARQADQAAAVKAYPWLNKKPETLTPVEAQMVGEFREILQMQPSLKQAPDYVSWVADAVAGRQARLARGNGSSARPLVPNPNQTKPAGGSRTPPQVVTRTAAAAPKVNPAQATVKAAQEKFRKTGNAKDYAAMLSAQAAARSQA